MLPDIHRTIVALASGPQPARRAIVRITGPQTPAILQQLCAQLPGEFWAAPRLTLCDSHVSVPLVRSQIPVTVLYWPNAQSYTGAPSAELHLLSCVPLAEALVNRCCQLGAHPAERGEFTLRAFLAGKLDLAQAEAVLGVINAESRSSLQSALSQLGGNLAPAIAPLRESLIDVLAELEAGLDFVDEDIQFINSEQITHRLQEVQNQLDQFSARLDTRSTTDQVPTVVLAGPPNSGKSSLFNALCGQSLAIVADVPGTTRDYLVHRIPAAGLPLDLVDTAGWEELHEPTPRAMAQQQLYRAAETAQVIVLCCDLTDDYSQVDGLVETWRRLRAVNSRATWMIVGTKADLLDDAQISLAMEWAESMRRQLHAHTGLVTSSQWPDSLRSLIQALSGALFAQECDQQLPDQSGPLAVVHETAVRCRSALSAARTGLENALEAARCGGAEELIAAELRMVLDDLATIVGDIHSDDILGEIFSRFCIGK